MCFQVAHLAVLAKIPHRVLSTGVFVVAITT